MITLLMLGNTRQETFGNAIVAAHHIALGRHQVGLNSIFVIHSPESETALASQFDWKQHIYSHGVDPSLICSVVINFDRPEQAIDNLAQHLGRLIRGLDDLTEEIYIDLTNGKSIYKNTLASIGFLLGVRHQFMIDVDLLNRHKASKEAPGFLPPEDLIPAYVELPDSSRLDSLAAAWLTEVRRFSNRANAAAASFAGIAELPPKEARFFETLVRSAFRNWLRADRSKNEAELVGSLIGFGKAFEELMKRLYTRLAPDRSQRKPLAEKITTVTQLIQLENPQWDPRVFNNLTSILRELRNYGAHEQLTSGAHIESVRARMAVEIFLCFLDYLDVLCQEGLPSQTKTQEPTPRERIRDLKSESGGGTFYFGLDGDDVGKVLEQMFSDDAKPSEFSAFSRTVETALAEVSKAAKKYPLRGEILFCAGDDLLFRGHYDEAALRQLQALFFKTSGGRTCSIGFGRTPRETYIALKIAKAQPGKNAIRGIEIVS
jgi:minimal CRISPR polymerase-like protein